MKTSIEQVTEFLIKTTQEAERLRELFDFDSTPYKELTNIINESATADVTLVHWKKEHEEKGF